MVGTFFGIGLFPVASGTVATLVAVPLYMAAYLLGGDGLILGLALASTAGGVIAAGALERTLGIHDPSEVVIDEVAGYMVTMLFVVPTVWTCLAGFLLFRAFDVLKFWPASRAEKLPGGWGIMADDLICGVLANVLLQAGWYLWA